MKINLIITVIFIGLILFLINNFISNSETFVGIEDKYNKYKIDTPLKEQRYLTFLDSVYTNYKLKANKESICNPQLNDILENEVLKSSYEKYKDNVPQVHKDKCTSIANYLCETTDPIMYTNENPYSAPRWLMKSYKNIGIPKMTNLNCFETNYRCCRKATDKFGQPNMF